MRDLKTVVLMVTLLFALSGLAAVSASAQGRHGWGRHDNGRHLGWYKNGRGGRSNHVYYGSYQPIRYRSYSYRNYGYYNSGYRRSNYWRYRRAMARHYWWRRHHQRHYGYYRNY